MCKDYKTYLFTSQIVTNDNEFLSYQLITCHPSLVEYASFLASAQRELFYDIKTKSYKSQRQNIQSKPFTHSQIPDEMVSFFIGNFRHSTLNDFSTFYLKSAVAAHKLFSDEQKKHIPEKLFSLINNIS